MAQAPVQATPLIPAVAAPATAASTGKSGWFGASLAGLFGRDRGIDIPDATPTPQADRGQRSYARLQARLILVTAGLAALAVLVTALLVNLTTAASVLVGSLAALLYLRLLARSVGRLGANDQGKARGMGKVQLIVPVVLVLAAARLPQLELLPALLGFLLYKPVLYLQVVHDS